MFAKVYIFKKWEIEKGGEHRLKRMLYVGGVKPFIRTREGNPFSESRGELRIDLNGKNKNKVNSSSRLSVPPLVGAIFFPMGN